MNHLASVITRDPQVCFTQINDNEIVILHSIDENFYHLNESAVDLWLSLEVPKQVVELTHILAQKYSGCAEDYQNDVMEWVEETMQKGLVIVKIVQ